MILYKFISFCCLLAVSFSLSAASEERGPVKHESEHFRPTEAETHPPSEHPSVKHKYVVLKALNKVSARVSTIEIPLGEATHFQRLIIVPTKAYKALPEDIPEVKAYLRIYEKTLDGQTIELFSGWMFASSPSSSAMEHPVYDVWVTDLIEK